MAISFARQLLDELMGRERDQQPTDKKNHEPEWCDERICKFYLVQFCPHQLFTNTKADIGPCTRVHDDYVKKAFVERATQRERDFYEDEFVKFCQKTLSDVERRIKRAKQRLAMSRTEKAEQITLRSSNEISEEVTKKFQEISEKIETLLSRIEELGCLGEVEEAQELMKEVESLKETKIAIKRDNTNINWVQQRAEIGVAQEKQMEVCDVCGAFLIVNDAQQRVDDHLMGKQHVGFGKLKTALDKIFEHRRSQQSDLDNSRNYRPSRRSLSPSPSRSRSRDRRRHDNHHISPNSRNTFRSDPRNHHRRHRSRSPRSRIEYFMLA